MNHTPDDEGGPAPQGPDLPGGAAAPESAPRAERAEPERTQQEPGPSSGTGLGFAPTEATAQTDPLPAAGLPDLGTGSGAPGSELELRRSAEVEPSGTGTLPAETDPAAALAVSQNTQTQTETEVADRGSLPHRARIAFRDWRHTRPFWGALLVNLGAAEILFTEKAPFKVVLHFGLEGLAGYLLPAVMLLCGFLIWFNPQQRTFYSILSMLLALGTWITSNLGGFVIGMLLGLVGAALAFGWTPLADTAAKAEKRRRRKPRNSAGPAAGTQISTRNPGTDGV